MRRQRASVGHGDPGRFRRWVVVPSSATGFSPRQDATPILPVAYRRRRVLDGRNGIGRKPAALAPSNRRGCLILVISMPQPRLPYRDRRTRGGILRNPRRKPLHSASTSA